MAILWQERTHDDDEKWAFNNPECRRALCDCGLLKFFLTPHLRAQPDFLELVICS